MAKFQNIAKKLLNKLSALDAVYQYEDGSVYDPATMTNVPNLVTKDLTIYKTKVSNGDIQAGIASATDLMILVSGLDLEGVTPKQGHKIIDSTGVYEVDKILPTNEANGVVALYKFVCKLR
jgi:hypothetical protein